MEEELKKKIDLYKKELERVTQELASKRTELASQTKKTVEDLDVSIVDLRSTASSLQSSIKIYVKEIDDLSKKRDALKESLEDKYNKLEKSLIENYESKCSQLSVNLKEVDTLKEDYINKTKSLDSRNSSLLEFENKLSIRNNEVSARQTKLEQDINNHNQKVASDSAKIESDKEKNRQLSIELQYRREELEKEYSLKLKEVSDKEVYVDGVLKKSEEFENREKAIAEREELLAKKEISVNQEKVKVMANINKNNARSAELERFSKSLDERESNIAVVESKLAK